MDLIYHRYVRVSHPGGELMTNETISTPEERPAPTGALWWTFRSQTVVGHALAVLGGFAVWCGAYVVHLSVVGGDVALAAAGGPEALVARQAGIQVATFACWLWFTLAFIVGKGGPALNITLYPIGAMLFGPPTTALTVVGRLPSETFTAAEPTSLQLVVVALGISMPGLLLSLAVLGLYFAVLAPLFGAREAWQETHMPDAWHEFVEEIEDWKAAQEES